MKSVDKTRAAHLANAIIALSHEIQFLCLKYAPGAISYGDVEQTAGVPVGLVFHHAEQCETAACQVSIFLEQVEEN
jgi:hypothetical protein